MASYCNLLFYFILSLFTELREKKLPKNSNNLRICYYIRNVAYLKVHCILDKLNLNSRGGVQSFLVSFLVFNGSR